MDKPLGRAKGGLARMEGTTAKERKTLAKKAADARWSGAIKQATHGSEDHPLKIGNIEIPCYVLADETRVLAQRGIMGGLNLGRGSTDGTGGDRIQRFLGGKAISPFVSRELREVIENPIQFRPPWGGRAGFGYPATILPDICDVVLAARKAGDLQKQQEHIADQCELLLRGLARVGIIALVDEATGFQRDRRKDALARILEAFVAKELQPWVKTFPDEYYAQMFRLRGLEYNPDSVKRPQYFGTLTNDIVYSRLAPSIVSELKKVIPKTENGRRKGALSQALTRNVGYPKLREHLGAVVAYMTMSKDYFDFREKLDRFRPRYGEQFMLPFDYKSEEDDGKGL